MQVSVETTGALERRIEVSVPRERIEQAIDERLKRVSRTAKLKGFRPGKVPFKVVKQQFGAQVRQEVLSDLMQSSFAEAVTQEKLNPAAGPRIEPISVGPEQDLKYRATFEVFPEIELKGVEGIAVARPALPVVVLDGDGSVLMNLGGLTTLARYRPRNLVHVVFDNESLLSVGGFPTATSTGSDLAEIARGAGVPLTRTVRTLDDFQQAFVGALAAGDLTTLVAKVEAVGPPTYITDLSLLENRYQFARHLKDRRPQE